MPSQVLSLSSVFHRLQTFCQVGRMPPEISRMTPAGFQVGQHWSARELQPMHLDNYVGLLTLLPR